jgi:TPR repeat protein
LNHQLLKEIGLPREGGALVTKVNENSPASFAGLQPGDLIESIEQTRVLNGAALARLVRSTPPGKKVEIILWRSGNGVEDLKGWLQSRAANNNTQAMRFLALAYTTELFGSASASEALKWTQMAANGGDVEAMVEMGSDLLPGNPSTW